VWGGGAFCDHLSGLQQYFSTKLPTEIHFWAAGRQKFLSSSTLLVVRYVPSPYRATAVTQLWATEASTDAYEEEKLTSSRSSSTADHGVWPLDFNNKNRLKKSSIVII
jgi:hypothetical protein